MTRKTVTVTVVVQVNTTGEQHELGLMWMRIFTQSSTSRRSHTRKLLKNGYRVTRYTTVTQVPPSPIITQYN